MSSKKSKSKEKFSGSITKTRAIKIFEALGFKTACNWDVSKLQKKIENLPNLVEGAKLDDKTQKRINVVLKALKDGRKVAVVDVEDAAADKKRGKAVEDAAQRESGRKAEKKAKGKKVEVKEEDKPVAKPKSKTKKKTKKVVVITSKEKKDVDKFGSRKGSDAAKVNAALGKKPKKMKQLMADAGLESSFYNHLIKLVEAGHVVKSDEGYAIVS